MKDKWTAYCVAGLSALFVIGVIGVIVTKPRNQIGITVKAELTTAAVTETEPDESSAEKTAHEKDAEIYKCVKLQRYRFPSFVM